MAQHFSPRIVTDGMILCLDAGNRESYVSGSSVWRDLIFNEVSGSLVGGPVYSRSNIGNITFNVLSQSINFGSLPRLQFTNSQTFSVSAWFRWTATSASRRSIYSYALSGSGYYVDVDDTGAVNTNGALFDYSDGTSFRGIQTTDNSIKKNTWNNITCTSDATNTSSGMKIYLNGSLASTSNRTGVGSPASINYNTLSAQVGGRLGASTSFDGNISQISIYNRELSAAEVLQNYNAMRSRYEIGFTADPPSPGVSYVPNQLVANPQIYLDAASNISYSGNGNTWYDLSGNSLHGTMTNITYTGTSMYFPGDGYIATPHASLVDLGNNFTIFVMAKVASAAGNHPFFSTYHDYNGNSIWGLAFLGANDTNQGMKNNQLRCYVGSGAWINRFACSNTSTVAASWKMYAVVCTNFGSNQNYTYYTDGNNPAGFYWWNVGGQSAGYWYRDVNDAKNSCFIGRQYSSSDPSYWDSKTSAMDMGVFMIYKSALTGAQIQQNFDYFKGRYGL